MRKYKPKNHIIVIDGTQSRLDFGDETNAGILYKLIEENTNLKQQTLLYDAGIQGHGFWSWVTLASGLGINKSIQNAYAHLSSKYETGDKIYLFGFSRGAYAVRSLAGMIAQVGLLRKETAIERRILHAFRFYECERSNIILDEFKKNFCHKNVPIQMIGIWDTVKSLGFQYPFLYRLAPMATEFHNDKIGGAVRFGFHALALNETRTAFRPVLWDKEEGWKGHLEQVWFQGAHSDIGGHVWAFPQARPLSNIPLVWMLERAENCGLTLPKDWQKRFPCDVTAPPIGDRYGIAKLFLSRKKRQLGNYPNEYIHPSAYLKNQNTTFSIPVLKTKHNL